MKTPLYPPATSYEAPKRLPRLLTTRDTPLSVLQSIPAAWAIVVAKLPGIVRSAGSGPMRPHLGNFSLASLVIFGVVPRDALPDIDLALKNLGEFQ